jgi:PAS domain S-box-containing protein
VAFLASDRQWFKSSVGLDRKESSLAASFCTHTIERGDLLVIENASEEERVAESPFVTEANLLFYAGVPITTPDGHAIGTFSIMDSEPQSLSEREGRRLQALAQMATEKLERRRETQKQKKVARRFTAVFEDPNRFGAVLSPDGTLTEINESFLKRLSEGDGEAIGRPFWALSCWPDERRKDVEAWIRRAAEGEYIELEADVRGPNGQFYDIEGTIRPVTDDDEAVTSLVVSARDVTVRREHERELRLFKSAVEQANDAVVITEAEPIEEPGPRIEYVNDAFEEMTGYEKEEIRGETPRVLQGQGTNRDVLDTIRNALEDGRAWKGETTNYRKDGVPYTVRWSMSPVRGEEGEIDHWISVQQDITEKRKREDSLRRQRNLLKQAQRLAGAWEVDLRSDEVTCSNKAFEILGVTPETDLEMEDVLQFYAPEARSEIQEAFKQCAEEGEPYDVELPLITAEGTRRWIRTVGAPAERQEGDIVKVAGAFQDITQRKEAEQTLREERDRLATLFQSLPTPVVYGWDDAGDFRVQNVNEAFEEVFRVSGQDIIGKPLQSIIGPNGEQIDESLPLLSGSQETAGREVQLETADGIRDFWVQVGLRKREAKPTEGYVIYTDITEQKNDQRRLERYREYTDDILDAVGDVLYILDDTGHLERWNESLSEVTGYTDEEIGEMHSTDFFSEQHAAEIAASIREVFETGDTVVEAPFRTKDGELIPHEFVASLVEDPDGNPKLAGIGRNITERKEREESLVQAKKKAEEASRLKSAMLANMSHEIRTPLTSVTGFAKLLQNDLEGKKSEFADRVYASGKRLQKTLDSVLQLSTLEAGVYEMEREELCLGPVVRESAKMFNLQAEEKSITLETHLPDSPVKGVWNEEALHRILENLLENAIKFTPKGGTVEVFVRVENGSAVLEVTDNGIGIREEAVPDIFEAFRQESQGRTREYEGSGLGLSIVKRLTEALGGGVEVESEKGEGSRFVVRFPQAEENAGTV